MGVNGITASTYKNTDTNQTKNKKNESDATAKDSTTTPAAVYEKSTETDTVKPVYKQDTATIAQLKADAQARTKQLRDLVEKMMLNQGQTFNDASMYELLREGKLTVDEKTVAQAKADIAADGYWGVNQTSDRLVSFAKALTGGDPDKIDEMMGAIKKGFEQAAKIWGGELPDICQQTLEATMGKLEEWRTSATL